MDLSLSSEQRNIQRISTVMIHSLNILRMNIVELNQLILQESKQNPAIELFEPPKGLRDLSYDKKSEFLESIQEAQSIESHILSQVPDWEQNKKDILLEILYNLDDNGFFKDDFRKIADKFHVSVDFINAVSDELKQLHPYGLSAKNLHEALIAQIENISTFDEIFKKNVIKIIKFHLHDILHGFFKKVAKAEHLSIDIVKEASKFISRLNFSPLSFFHSEDIVAIIPDLKIFKRDDTWLIEINEHDYPQIRFSKIYKEAHSLDKGAKKYMKECARRGKILSQAIYKRNMTLYKIAQVILDNQKQFFEFGPKWMKNLSLTEVARSIHVSVSTVSRAISGKYADTPFGIKKMSQFFESGVKDYSSTFIKTEIKKIIQRSKTNLSDQKITDFLNSKGIVISRRTVTKYRQQENLPNSRIRKVL